MITAIAVKDINGIDTVEFVLFCVCTICLCDTGIKAAAEKRNLYRKLLKSAGVDPKRIETVLKVSDLENVTVKDGAIEGADKLTEGIKADWADFIATTTVEGADVAHAPKGEGGKDINEMSTAEYMKYKAKQRG